MIRTYSLKRFSLVGLLFFGLLAMGVMGCGIIGLPLGEVEEESDTTPPQVESARSTGNTSVEVTFSEAVDEGAGDAGNYTIAGSTLVVTTAELIADNKVTLTTEPQSEVEYTLTVSGVKDETGNSIDPDANTTTFTGTAPPLEQLVAIAIIPPQPTIEVGASQQFSAIAIYDDGTTVDMTSQVSWSSSDTAVATLDSSGLATTGATAGSVTITATLGGISGTATLTVTSAKLVSIDVTPTEAKIEVSATQQFTAISTYDDGSTRDLTPQVSWSSSDTTVVTLDTGGLATGGTAGVTTITATLGGISGTATLTVTSAKLISIDVTPTEATIGVGATQGFTAIGTYDDEATEDLTTQVIWSSGATEHVTIDEDGLATGILPGGIPITATIGDISGTAYLQVIGDITFAQLTSIWVTPTAATIEVSATQQFTAIGRYNRDFIVGDKIVSEMDLTTQVSWSSDATAIATIDSSGIATGVAEGSVTITATLGSISRTINFYIAPAPLVSIAVTPAQASIEIGDIQQFTAIGTFADGSTEDLTSAQKVTYSSSDDEVATIDFDGLATGVTLGSVTITVTSGTITGDTISATAALTVTGTLLSDVISDFTDANLAACVNSTAANSDANYTSQVRDLSCQNQNIEDLSGIENLTKLADLSLSNNSIDDVTLLGSLTNLTNLHLSGNSITIGVAGLVTLINATEIDLGGSSNNSIPCADLDTLKAALTSATITGPPSCT